MNLGLFAACVCLEQIGISFEGLPLFAFCNLILCLLNLLPAIPFDGGRALRAYLMATFDIVKADCTSKVLSVIFLLLLLALGFFVLTVTRYNISLVLLALWMLFMLFFNSSLYRTPLSRHDF
jgi:stage IV sporulation protein FB